MSENCESSRNSKNGSSGGNDIDSCFPYIFPRNWKIMDTYNPKPKDVRGVGFVYTNKDHISSLQQQVYFCSSYDKEEVVMKACL